LRQYFPKGTDLSRWTAEETQQTERLALEIAPAGSLAELSVGTVKEIDYVLDLAPRFLWVVGSGSVDPATHVFSVTVDGLNARFDLVGGFPKPI
jgi:hypothetical protein